MNSLLIPEIAKKIEKVLKRLKLRPEESPEKFIERTKGRKHRYSSICRKKGGQRLIFYARLHDSINEKEKMQTEVKIAKVLIRKKVLVKCFPKYFDAKIEKNFEWLLREYFPARPLEDRKKIEELKKRLHANQILKISKILLEIQNINLSNFPFLKKFSVKKYFDLVQEIQKEKILTKKEIKKLKKLLKENRALLKSENRYFCHGDFQIGNILFFGQKSRVIDLESAHINNFVFDIAFLTSRFWKKPKVRKKIINDSLFLLSKDKEKIFKTLFRINCLFVGYHSFKASPIEYTPKILEKRKDFYKRLIKASVKSFEGLVNL